MTSPMPNDMGPCQRAMKQIQDQADIFKQSLTAKVVEDEQRKAVENSILDTVLAGGEHGALFSILSLIPIKFTTDVAWMAASADTLFINQFICKALSKQRCWSILHHELYHLRNRHQTRGGRLLKRAQDNSNTRYIKYYNAYSNPFLDVWCDGEVVSARHVHSDHQFSLDHLNMCRDQIMAIENFDSWSEKHNLGNEREDEIALLDNFIKHLIDTTDPEDDPEGEGEGGGGIGGIIPETEDIDTAEAQLASTLMAAARMAGVDPGQWGIDIPTPDTRPLMIDIIKLAAEEGNTKWSGAKIDQELAQNGMLMPSKCLADNRPIATILDVSGSMINDTDLPYAIGQLEQLNEETPVLVIPFDGNVKKAIWCEEGNVLAAIKNSIEGGGGTSFNPPVEYLNSLHDEFSCVVFLTDGYGHYTDGLSTREITWISTGADTRDLDSEGDHYLARLA